MRTIFIIILPEIFDLNEVVEQLRGEEELRHLSLSHGDESHLGTFQIWLISPLNTVMCGNVRVDWRFLQLVAESTAGVAVLVRCITAKKATEFQIAERLGNGFSLPPFATVVVRNQPCPLSFDFIYLFIV